MASQLKVDTLTGVTTAGSISVTGEGNSTTTNLQQGLAKAWSHYNTITNTAQDTLNISGITDNGTGDHSFSVSNAFSNANYVVVAFGQEDTGGGARIISGKGTPTSSQRQVDVNTITGSARALLSHTLTFHGALA